MTFDPFAPFTQWGQFLQNWQKIADESISRTNAFYAEVEKAEAKRLQHMESAIDEMAKFQKESLAYGARLNAEWRKMSLEAFQKAAAAFVPSAQAA
jgi:hypothetical protein